LQIIHEHWQKIVEAEKERLIELENVKNELQKVKAEIELDKLKE